MNYAPEGKPAPVVEKGEFPFAAVALDHGHIYGQCKGLTEAGGDLRYVYDPDPEKVDKFCKVFAGVEPLPSLEAVLEKPEIKLVTGAAVPCDRGPLGLRVMDAGKDYFRQAPFTSFEHLAAARAMVRDRPAYMVYYANGSMWKQRSGPANSRPRGARTGRAGARPGPPPQQSAESSGLVLES